MGGLWELRFSATKAWSVVPADPVHAEWYRIEPAEGDNGNGTVKVTVLPNITTEKRSAEIIIRSGRAEQRLSFAQQASDMEPCGEEEVRRFLEKLYQDTGGDNWRFPENWCTDKPLSEWLKSEILDLSHYQNFYEFPKFRIKLLILILLHFNIVRIIY